MKRVINQNTEPLFIFDMPDDETLAHTISVKGEKGDRGDPTKLSDLENDEGFIDNTVDDLANYYTKTATDSLLNTKLDKTTFNAYDIPSDFFTGTESVSGSGSSITLTGTAASILKNISIYGETVQSGTPTPSSPSWIHDATGEQTITIGDGLASKTYKINFGKNLYTGVIETAGYIIGSDGSLTPLSTGLVSEAIQIEPSAQYTISWTPLNDTRYLRIAFYDITGAFISRTSKNSLSWTFTAPANARFYRFSYATGDSDVQLERGSSATSYAKYIEPIDLGHIANKDYIYRSNGAWYVHKTTGKYTFDGTESWSQSGRTSTTSYVAMLNILTLLGASFASRSTALFTHGVFSDTTTMPVGTFAIYNNNSGVANHMAIALDPSTITDIDAFKAWVAANKPTVEYELAAPIEVEITETAIIEQLDDLARAFSYLGNTYISITAVLPATLSAEAYKSNWSGTTKGVNDGIKAVVEPATETKLGTIKVGTGLSIDDSGKLSALADSELSTVSTVPVQNSVVSSAIDKLQNASYGLVGISRDSSSTDDYYVLYSPDGEKFYQCGEKLAGFTDASALIEIKGKYYYFGNNICRFSSDLASWSSRTTIKTDFDRRIYASMAYYDAENDTVYIYSAYQYNDDTLTTPFGGTAYYFKIGYQTATINADGSLNIDQTVHDLLYEDGETYIDPYVVKDPYLGYVLAYKDEATAKVSIVQMSSLTTVSGSPVECPAFGIEAPQLVSTPFGLVCYVDGYALSNSAKTGISNMPNVSAYFLVSYKSSILSTDSMGLVPISAPITLRHLGLMPCTSKALYHAQQLGIKPYPPFISNSAAMANGLRQFSTSSVASPTLVNFPFAIYTIPVSKTVTIRNEFKSSPLRLYIPKGVAVTWGTDSMIQSACKGKTFTATKDEILTLYADSVYLSSSMWVPYDRT